MFFVGPKNIIQYFKSIKENRNDISIDIIKTNERIIKYRERGFTINTSNLEIDEKI